MATRSLLNTPPDTTPDTHIVVNGKHFPAHRGELLIDTLNRTADETSSKKVPHVCYLQQMGPIQTCDTCMVEVGGRLVRACATPVTPGMAVLTEGEHVDIAQREAFDRILQNHELYCTVCDNNNQNCTVHNATADLDVKHQARPFAKSRTRRTCPTPSTATIPTSASSAAAASKAARTSRSTRPSPSTGTSPHPRVLWDGGEKIAGSSCVSCGHCVTVCPCNALMEKSMLGHAGYLTQPPRQSRSTA